MEQQEIGKEISSGAEKVERIEEEAAREQMEAERRVNAAREKLRVKSEKKAARAAELDELEREQEERRRQRNGGDGNGNGGKKRGDGLGGWIAAVVSLGAVSLVLTAVVTVGAIRMSQQNATDAASYRGTMYEVIGIVEKVDDDLDTLRISESPSMQSELLTDILVQTRMAEADLEKLPIEPEKDRNVMGFFNHTSRACERMLEKLALGESLSEQDKAMIEEIYKVNHATREILDELAANVEDKDITGFMNGKESRITDALENVENNTVPPELKKPVQPRDKGMMPMPNKAEMKDRAGIPSEKAEELCKYYFADYKIAETVYAGETLGKGLKAYNFEMRNEDGVRLFAQISQDDGSLIRFDYYEECNSHMVDIETARGLAESFLEKLGYTDMIAVNVDESGTNADFTFAYYQNGCVYYPDEVTVKVCEERGLVSGLDAGKYLRNHDTRDELNANLTMQEAREKLSDKLSVESSRLVLFEHKGREYTAYEFFCAHEGEFYFVYLDATDGRELFIVNSQDM